VFRDKRAKFKGQGLSASRRKPRLWQTRRARREAPERQIAGFEAVERATDLPMLLLARALIPLMVAPLVFDPSGAVEDVMTALE
jgi:hypothetical protein